LTTSGAQIGLVALNGAGVTAEIDEVSHR